MEDPNIQETFNFFKEVLFEKLIKREIVASRLDLFSIPITIVNIEILETYYVDDIGDIYPKFIVELDNSYLGLSNFVKIMIISRISRSLDRYYPTDNIKIARHLIEIKEIQINNQG